MATFQVDLKWSLWGEASYWANYPEVVEAMQQAFRGGEEAHINTSPRKEIRFGTVVVSKGEAEVDFYVEWDRPDGALEAEFFEEHNDDGEPIPASIIRKVKAKTFDRLMRGIDQAENDLLTLERERSNAYEEWVAGLEAERAAEWAKERARPFTIAVNMGRHSFRLLRSSREVPGEQVIKPAQVQGLVYLHDFDDEPGEVHEDFEILRMDHYPPGMFFHESALHADFPRAGNIFTVWAPFFNPKTMSRKIPAGFFLQEIQRKFSRIWGWG